MELKVPQHGPKKKAHRVKTVDKSLQAEKEIRSSFFRKIWPCDRSDALLEESKVKLFKLLLIWIIQCISKSL